MIYQGDALSVLTGLDPESIDMCMTSPPYWGLRDYGNEQIFGGDVDCEHEWGTKGKSSQRLRNGIGSDTAKVAFSETLHPSTGRDCLKCHAWKGQLGLEPTPELYIEHMTAVFHEVKRVLKKEGVLFLNIGDTYSGSGKGSGDDGPDPKFKGGGRERTLKPDRNNSLPPKCLCMIPERLAWSLVQDGWILRNKIIWYKPNAMPSSVKDRFTNKYEFIYMFSQQQKYYFDLDAVREPHLTNLPIVNKQQIGKSVIHKKDEYGSIGYGDLGKNPGDVFEIEDGILKGHLAYKINQFEEAHPEMDAGWFSDLMGDIIQSKLEPSDFWQIPTQPFPEAHFAVFPEKLCQKPIKAGCPEDGTVLDPFCGAGTVGVVAKMLGRNFIGIDIKKEYCDMAEKRIAKVGHQQELAL